MVKLAFLSNDSSRSEVEYGCTRCNFTQLLRGFKTKKKSHLDLNMEICEYIIYWTSTLRENAFQGILNLSNSPSMQLRCRLWRRLFPAHPGSVLTNDAWVTFTWTNRQPDDPANRIGCSAGWNPKLAQLWSNMSDNAESPTESQKEEPQPAPEDSATNDQKKKSRHAYMCTCIYIKSSLSGKNDVIKNSCLCCALQRNSEGVTFVRLTLIPTNRIVRFHFSTNQQLPGVTWHSSYRKWVKLQLMLML